VLLRRPRYSQATQPSLNAHRKLGSKALLSNGPRQSQQPNSTPPSSWRLLVLLGHYMLQQPERPCLHMINHRLLPRLQRLPPYCCIFGTKSEAYQHTVQLAVTVSALPLSAAATRAALPPHDESPPPAKVAAPARLLLYLWHEVMGLSAHRLACCYWLRSATFCRSNVSGPAST
jgi:hypothetical protein